MTDEPVAPVDAGQAPPSVWTDGFSDEMKGYVETKGFADAGALATSYQNLEKLRGVPEDQLLRWPDDPAAAGAMDPVYTKMGRPETAAEYTNTLGDGFDGGVFAAAAERAHQLGLGDGQFQGLQQIMQDQAVAMQEKQETDATTAFDQWKAANETGFQDAARVMSAVGMNEDGIAALLAGDKTAIYDFAAKVGAKTSEAAIVHGDKPQGEGFGMSVDAAKVKISELFTDKAFTDAYYSGSRTIRQPAIDRMMALQKLAHPEGA